MNAIDYFNNIPQECAQFIISFCERETLLILEAINKVWQSNMTKNENFLEFKNTGVLVNATKANISSLEEVDQVTVQAWLKDVDFRKAPKVFVEKLRLNRGKGENFRVGFDLALKYVERKVKAHEFLISADNIADTDTSTKPKMKFTVENGSAKESYLDLDANGYI